MSQLVLAIEPDLRQSVIVARIVREKVHADVTVVDSRDAALEAIGRAMPDVLLLSALLSPRDEDELVAHLRTLAHAGHLQTHTIPQLASSLMGPSDPERGGRGLLAKFRRRKEPEKRVATGCDPDVFAEEIRVFLQRAADKKRELLEAAPGAREWSAIPARTSAPAAEPASAGPADSSSWASPFEWPSDRPSLISDPESLIAPPESLIPDPESPIVHAESHGRDREPVVEASFSPVGDLESLVGRLESPAADSARLVAQPEAPHAATEPALPVEKRGADALIAHEEEEKEEEEDETNQDRPTLAARPIEDHVDSLLELTPATEEQFEIDERFGIGDTGSGMGDAGSGMGDAGSGMGDAGSGMGDAGLEIRDQRLGMRDPDAPPRLGSLATWTRSEAARPVARASADDLRAIIAGLAVPPTIASVAYARGCRIRRVRVPGGPQARLADVPGPVILSRKLLEENRIASANP